MTNDLALLSASIPRFDPNARYFVGLDLGQRRDYTAIAVVERITRFLGERNRVTMAWLTETRHRLRYLERVPLGTPYPDIVTRVGEIVTHRGIFSRCELVVDATGVGTPVVDLLKRARLQCEIYPVYIHGGDASHREGNLWRVPKRELVVGLQVMLETGTLDVAEGMEHGETLVKELRDMRVQVSPSGHESYSAWRTAQHDDLVLAVALAAWRSTISKTKSKGTKW